MNVSLNVNHIPDKVNIISDVLSGWESARRDLGQLLPTYRWAYIAESQMFIDWSI